MGFFKEYNEWRKEHRQEVQAAELRKQLVKAPLDYVLLEQFMAAFIDKNQRDLKLEIKGEGFTVTLFYDEDGKVSRNKTSTEQILDQYRGVLA